MGRENDDQMVPGIVLRFAIIKWQMHSVSRSEIGARHLSMQATGTNHMVDGEFSARHLSISRRL